jgi:nucleotide-binding universal stress UspA family protein
MYQKMLVPLDGSELAEVVFPYAKELAGRLGVETILLHISSPALRDFAAMNQAYIEHAAEIIRREARKVHKDTGTGKTIKVTGELVVGYPAEEILRYADEKSVDLILMATHGRSGLKRWAVGSVADKVLRAANFPVWLVRANAPGAKPFDEWPKRTLLVALDGSELAESVLPHVEILAKQGDGELVEVVLLRICEPLTIPSYYTPEISDIPLNWGQYAQQEMARCKQVSAEYLTQIKKRLKDANISAKSEVLVGKAADEIIDYAHKNPFSLIIMATHGRSGLSRLVYGSVAESVLIGVNSPIFLVKPTVSK